MLKLTVITASLFFSMMHSAYSIGQKNGAAGLDNNSNPQMMKSCLRKARAWCANRKHKCTKDLTQWCKEHPNKH